MRRRLQGVRCVAPIRSLQLHAHWDGVFVADGWEQRQGRPRRCWLGLHPVSPQLPRHPSRRQHGDAGQGAAARSNLNTAAPGVEARGKIKPHRNGRKQVKTESTRQGATRGDHWTARVLRNDTTSE